MTHIFKRYRPNPLFIFLAAALCFGGIVLYKGPSHIVGMFVGSMLCYGWSFAMSKERKDGK